MMTWLRPSPDWQELYKFLIGQTYSRPIQHLLKWTEKTLPQKKKRERERECRRDVVSAAVKSVGHCFVLTGARKASLSEGSLLGVCVRTVVHAWLSDRCFVGSECLRGCGEWWWRVRWGSLPPAPGQWGSIRSRRRCCPALAELRPDCSKRHGPCCSLAPRRARSSRQGCTVATDAISDPKDRSCTVMITKRCMLVQEKGQRDKETREMWHAVQYFLLLLSAKESSFMRRDICAYYEDTLTAARKAGDSTCYARAPWQVSILDSLSAKHWQCIRRVTMSHTHTRSHWML